MKTCLLFSSLDNDELHAFSISEVGKQYNIVKFIRSNKNSPHLDSVLKENLEVDYIFNFLSPKLLSPRILNMARACAINFHPGSYEYPGVGSASMSLFDRQREYGVSAHIMEPLIDSGPIICERFFKIPEDIDSSTLFNLALMECKELLIDTLKLLKNDPIPSQIRSWARPPVSRAEFEEWLFLLNIESNPELELKIHSSKHPTFPGPYIRVGQHVFSYLRSEAEG